VYYRNEVSPHRGDGDNEATRRRWSVVGGRGSGVGVAVHEATCCSSQEGRRSRGSTRESISRGCLRPGGQITGAEEPKSLTSFGLLSRDYRRQFPGDSGSQ
jgi:hypothetical protein